MQTTPRGLTAVEPLAWDSAHLGQPVGRIVMDADEPSALAEALERAGDDGYSLVYVFTSPTIRIPDPLLRRFDGLKVDDRVVFTAELADDDRDEKVADPGELTISEWPRREPSPALVELAVAAGAYSRFGVDRRIPAEAFRRLYEIWIARSCLGETADVVLTAEGRDAPGDPLGLVTIAARGDEATIGLVAVGPRARRRGVGRSMMRHAREWLRRRGARRVSVATQEANAPACALYEACGYRPASRETIYHFRPRPAVVA